MKSYPSYKDSGVEWIGEIPSHWEVKKIKRIANVVNGSTPKSSVSKYWNGEITWITTDDLGKLESKIILDSRRKITTKGLESCGTKLVPENSIVLSTRAPIGHIGITSKEACTNQGCKAIVLLKKFDSNYYYYYFYSAKEYLQSLGRGTTFQELSTDGLKEANTMIPPLPEQTAIADFLDQKTGEIDLAVKKGEERIRLLKEYRAAMIHEAVTRGVPADIAGIDQGVEMKESGIEYIGEIPKHWEVKKLKYELKSLNKIRVPLSAQVRGEMKNKKYDYYGASGVIDKVDDYLFNEDLILIGEDGANLLTRSKKLVFIASGKYWVNNHAHILKPIKGEIRYFAELLETYDFSIWVTGSAQPKLTSENLSNISILVPPIEEQHQIVEYIETETARLDAEIRTAEEEIRLLQEYREALISEAVTGKIDVRDYPLN